MAANLSWLKSTQYLLICRAGLAVSAESEAASEELKRDMLQEFKDAVAKFSISDDLKGYPTDILMRSKNFIARICKTEDLHTGTRYEISFYFVASNRNTLFRLCLGDTLWRKFKDIKAVIINDLSAVYATNLPGGQPPSGISYQEILDKTRQVIHEFSSHSPTDIVHIGHNAMYR